MYLLISQFLSAERSRVMAHLCGAFFSRLGLFPVKHWLTAPFNRSRENQDQPEHHGNSRQAHYKVASSADVPADIDQPETAKYQQEDPQHDQQPAYCPVLLNAFFDIEHVLTVVEERLRGADQRLPSTLHSHLTPAQLGSLFRIFNSVIQVHDQP